MTNKRQTRRSVSVNIEKLKKINADRQERVSKLQAEISTDSAKIKELEKLCETLAKEELRNKLTGVSKSKILTEEQTVAFIEISKKLMDKIEILDVRAVMEAIGADSANSDLLSVKPAQSKSKIEETEESDIISQEIESAIPDFKAETHVVQDEVNESTQ